ncbi:MAG: lysostaphin resistance A-like protein [Caldilineaceae bacterium]
MNTVTTFAKRHALVIYFLVTYVITFGLFTQWDSTSDGLTIGSIPWFSFAPLITALVIVPLTAGWSGLKTLLSRLVRWRVGWRWYGVAFGLPLVVITVAVIITTLTGAPAPTTAQLAEWPNLFVLFLLLTIFSGPLGEDPGWRGYALERLQGRYSPLVATLILNLLGLLWHAPLFFVDNITWPVVVTILAGWLVLNWMYNCTNGSVLLVILMHGALNALSNFTGQMYTGANLVQLNMWEALGWAAVALVIIVATRGQLGLNKNATSRQAVRSATTPEPLPAQ